MRARRIDTLANRNRNRLPNHGAKWKKALAWAVAAWTLGMAPEAFAHPILHAAGAGVNIATDGNVMNITSSQPNNLIKWVDFSISGGKTVDFHDKNYLNYVTGSAVSDIQGTLKGTGSIYLVNPNGILIGDKATVNVGNLHLSTKALAPEQLANYETATAALPSAAIGSGDVLNLGTLKATSITVEGNNITFKNVANVNDGSAANVTLTANSAGEIHIGSANASTPAYTMNGTEKKYMYKLVHNPTELQNMKDDLAGNYMLAGDIDMSSFGNFTPIGYNYSNRFTGKFDGLNYKIKNLTINLPDTYYVGLFGDSEGRIENVGMVGGSITGKYNVGGIVGLNRGTVENVYNTGTVSGYECVGGIVGWCTRGGVWNVYNTGTVSGTNDVGGIVGYHGGTVENAYNTGTGTVSGTREVGGIVGMNNNGTVKNAYNTDAVIGTSLKIGGIVGYQYGTGFTTNVYNSGTVNGNKVTAICGSGTAYVGGIVGQAADTDKVTHAYTSDSKNATAYGGFDFSENGAWRIYDGQTMPLLTAFLTRKDNITTTTYDGSVDVGEVAYRATTYSGVQEQIGGYNYIKDASVVTPANLTVSFGDISKTYDGTTSATAGTATLNGIVNSDAVSLAEGVTATYDHKNAGTNKTVNYSGLALTGDKAKNYNLATTATGKGTIEKANVTISVEDYSRAYDGTTSATGAALKTVTGQIFTGDTVSGGTKTFDGKDAGAHTIAVSNVTVNDGNNGNNYNVTFQNGTGTITAAPLTISTDAVTKEYDGTTSAAGAAAKVASGTLYGTDAISGGTFAFTDKNAGTGKAITVSNVTISDGNNGNNYAVTYQSGTGTITPKALTATFADISKTYNGTTTATAGAGTLTGLIAADAGKVSVSATAAYDTKNVGTGKTVNYTGVTLTGEEKDNYTIADNATGSGEITKANVTFTVEEGYSREYDGTDSTTGATLKTVGTIYDNISGGTFTLDSRNAGTRTISVSGVTIDDGNGGNNYAVTYQDGTGTITAAPVTFTVKEGFTRVYDGTTDTTGATLKTVGTLYDNISGGTFTLDSKNAGTRTIAVSDVAIDDGNGGNNYAVTYQSGTGTITPKALTATFADISRTYDGTTNATAGAGTLAGVETIDEGEVSVSATAAYDTKNVGTGKTVNYTGVALTGGEAANYTIATTATGSGTINPADVTFTVEEGYTREYDGTESTTGATLKTVGTIYGSDTVSGGTFTLDSRNAGTRTLSVSGVAIDDGNGGNNYNVTFQNGTGTITAAPLTVSTDAVTKAYDGTTSATGAARVASGQLYGADAISGGTFAFADKNAGTGKAIAVSGVTVSDGNGGNNYAVTYQNGTGTITAAPLTISTDAVTKEYDGTTSAAGAAAKVASGTLYGADAISGGTFAFADKNAGTGKAITVSNVTINDGNGGNNYNVTYQSGTGTITRKALELVADAKTITEGEARPAFTGRVTGFVEGEGLENASDLSFAPANPAAAAAGIYKVTGRLKGAASGDYGMNYTFANAAANDTAFTIEARSILPQEIISNQIEASGAAQEYKGTVTALESTARAENQAALPQQEKFAGGTTANYVSHLTIENGGTNTPPNMDVAAAMSGEKAEQTAASSAGTKAAPAAEAIADRATADEEE